MYVAILVFISDLTQIIALCSCFPMMCLLLAIYLCLNFEVQSCSSYEQWTVL